MHSSFLQFSHPSIAGNVGMASNLWSCSLADIQVVPPVQLSALYSAACPPVDLSTQAQVGHASDANRGRSASRQATPVEASATPHAADAGTGSIDQQPPSGQSLVTRHEDTTQGQELGSRLGLGQALVLNAQPVRPSTATQHAADGGHAAEVAHANIDTLMFTGGLVWSTAFCPMQTSHGPVSEAAATGATKPAADSPPPAKRPRSGSHHTAAAAAAAKVNGTAAGSCQQQEAQAPAGAAAGYNAAMHVWRGDGTSTQVTELLAVAVHPGGDTRHLQGAMQTGQGAVQLWALPSSTQSHVCPSGMPRCIAGLVHDGKVVWDLQWCPEPCQYFSSTPPLTQQRPQPQQPAVRVVGIMAVAVGDGSVQVWVVPDPTDALLQHHIHVSAAAQQSPPMAGNEGLHAQGTPKASSEQQQQEPPQAGMASQGSDAAAAAAAGDGVGNATGQMVMVGGGDEDAGSFPGLRVRPQVVLSSEQLGGGAANCVAWRPNQPHLLVGCWDGSVSLWQLPGSATQPLARLSPLLFIRADGTPVRRLLWHPVPPSDMSAACTTSTVPGTAQAAAGTWLRSLDDVQHHLFMSCSQSGHVRVWDDRDTCCPVLDKVVSRTAVYDAVWLAGPQPGRVAIVVVLDDGTTRCLDFSPSHYYLTDKAGFISVMSGMDPACLWSVSYSGGLNLLAVAGEEGVVAVATMEQEHDNRMRKPHVPVGGLVSDQGVLRVLGPRQVAGLPCVYSGGASYSACFGVASQSAAARKTTTSEMRDNVQTLYTVTWSPNVHSVLTAAAPPHASSSSGAAAGRRAAAMAPPSGPKLAVAWLAYGGLSGLVRCQRVGVEVD